MNKINYSPAGLTLVSRNENTKTITIIIKSIIISNGLAELNNVTIPIAHITIKTIGSKYLIINIHVLPTEKVENSFNAGKKCSKT